MNSDFSDFIRFFPIFRLFPTFRLLDSTTLVLTLFSFFGNGPKVNLNPGALKLQHQSKCPEFSNISTGGKFIYNQAQIYIFVNYCFG